MLTSVFVCSIAADTTFKDDLGSGEDLTTRGTKRFLGFSEAAAVVFAEAGIKLDLAVDDGAACPGREDERRRLLVSGTAG